MRHASIACLVLALLVPAAAEAQPRKPKVMIDSVRIGFPSMGDPGTAIAGVKQTLYKAGFWAPVYVDLTAGPDGIAEGRVVIEAADSDDVQNAYTVPLPRGGLGPNEARQILTYTKPGSMSGEVTVTVVADNKSFEFKKSLETSAPGDVVCLAVGSRLDSLRKALADMNARANARAEQVQPGQDVDQNKFAYLDDVRMMPTRWYGYEGIDLMVLTTSNREFVEALLHDRENRKEALGEWVRRGGRLVISCGRNQDVMTELLARLQLDLPVAVKGPQPLEHLLGVETWVGNVAPLVVRRTGPQPGLIETARLQRTGPGLEAVVPPREERDQPLLIARAAQGLGQVVLVGFDLDGPAFAAWRGQGEFWKKLQTKTHTQPAAAVAQGVPAVGPGMRYGYSGEVNDLSSNLEKYLEQFQDVSVISFGWVALFIFIYIIIVGPLDYLFLKKVVKRLELTWITFPAVVLVVSAAAYFAAYSLKGNDLKINKLDLVDIDLHGGRSYGRTWFTLFSPRIQLYTVGVEPGTPTWAAEPADPKAAPAAPVSWLGRPDMGYGGYNRARATSLFRRTYNYAPDAAGLTGVPIQVWSTKSFTASWEGPYDAARPPLTARLRRSAGALLGVEGTLVSHLPGPLTEATLIWSDNPLDPQFKAQGLGTLNPGETVKVQPGQGKAQDMAQWVLPGGPQWGSNAQNPQIVSLMHRILFHDFAHDPERNHALHALDQTGRPGHRSEVILFGRLGTPASGTAEDLTKDPATPSRLWLGQLPGTGQERPALQGSMSQDTFVRLFIPLEAAAGDR